MNAGQWNGKPCGSFFVATFTSKTKIWSTNLRSQRDIEELAESTHRSVGRQLATGRKRTAIGRVTPANPAAPRV
jgi:hypothetical protein